MHGNVADRRRTQKFAELRERIVQHRVALKRKLFPSPRLDAFRRLRQEALFLLDDLEERRLLRGLLRIAGIRHQKRVRLRNEKERVVAAKAAEITKIRFLIDDDGVHILFTQELPQP